MNLPAALSVAEPLERVTLGEQAYVHLADLLMSGRLAPGEKLSLRRAAEALGVSMMPVREAVSRLVADKALEVSPNRAVHVPVMSAAQFRDLTKVRIAIEGYAAAQAALLRTPEELSRVTAANEAFRKESFSKKPDLAHVVELNKEFHFAVYSAARSPILFDVIRVLWLKAGPIINLDLRENSERLKSSRVISRHAEAASAIRAKDDEAARTAITRDISGASEFILSRGRLPE